MTDVLKEYLVKLGFKVDNQMYNQFKKALKDAEGSTGTFSIGAVSNMSKASLAVVSFVATANVGIASYIGSLARADMDTELFARRMWITADQGKAIQESLKATGRSIEDVWFSPELRQQFIELQKTANEVKPPEGFKEQMQEVRNVQLEFMKLRVILAYASQWIGFYLTKYLSEPIAKVKKGISDLNAYIKANMPKLSADFAKFLSGFVRVAESIIWAISNIIKLIDSLPDNVKKTGAALIGVFALIASGPLGWIIAGLSLMMLLIEDFYTFSEGGKSAFPGLWSWVQDTFGTGSEFAKEFGDDVEKLNQKLGELFEAMSKLTQAFDKENVLGHFISALGSIYQLVKDIVDLMFPFGKILSMITGTDFEMNDKNAGGIAKDVNWFLDMIKGASEGLSDMLTGETPIRSEYRTNTSSYSPTIINTNNIYGSDAYAIGSQVNRNFEDMSLNMRDLQGVYR